MIGGRIAAKVAAVAAIATAVVLCVVALGSAAWYGLVQVMPNWGAALVLAAIMAAAAGIVGLLAFGKPMFRSAPEPEPESLTHRLIGFAKERPIAATAAGLAAGFIFLRNPALATIVAAALSGAPSDDGSKRRR